ncbi:MAG: hypothetical protein IJ720_01225 [Clostridia bacterium]|nr:hypothetical protein [Clostridia bacterium]MBR1703969.1 hypothetical protein [Clostridia bacterium]
MKIQEIVALIDAEVKSGSDKLEEEVSSAFGSDMMSEVLAYVQNQGVLLTGLVNEQIIRTAAMMNMYCIIMVRGKQPTDNMVEMAEDNDLVLLTTERTLYETSGILYTNGLNPAGHSYV